MSELNDYQKQIEEERARQESSNRSIIEGARKQNRPLTDEELSRLVFPRPASKREPKPYRVELDTTEYHLKVLWDSIPTWMKWVLPFILAILFQALIGGASPWGTE
jgi:hypothetical protein